MDKAIRSVSVHCVGYKVQSNYKLTIILLSFRLGDALDSQSIRYGRLDGAMNRDQRTVAMDTFKLDPACEILLVSLRAGGVG